MVKNKGLSTVGIVLGRQGSITVGCRFQISFKSYYVACDSLGRHETTINRVVVQDSVKFHLQHLNNSPTIAID